MFNYAFCIEPYYKRFTKFVKVSAEYKKLPADAPARDRRASVINLEAAAADIIKRGNIEEELVASLFEDRKVNRRATLPPSAFSGNKGSKRSSLLLLRSSMGDVAHLLSQLDTIKED